MKATEAVAPVSSETVEFSKIQFSVISQEIAAIEKLTNRAAIVAADNTGKLVTKVNEAFKTGQISRELLENIALALDSQNAAVAAVMAVSVLAARMNDGDLSPKA